MKRKHQEEHANHEAWAVPYADLLTLMLAFFVVMYSLSQINVSKYRVLAEALNQAFNGTGKVIQPTSPAEPTTQFQVPDHSQAANTTPIALINVPLAPQHLPLPGHEGAAQQPSPGDDVDMANLKAISSEVAKALQPWVDSGEVVIRQTKQWLEIEIRTDILFPSGVATLSDPAQKVLEGVATVLGRFPNPIRIEGYTDDRPIETARFPSNWELSAGRAGSVARLISEHGVDPDRIGILGWGEYRPVASNATPEGRNRNRRIAIVVLSDGVVPPRYYRNGSSAPPATVAAQPPAAQAPALQPAPAAPSTGKAPATAGVTIPDVAPLAPVVALHRDR